MDDKRLIKILLVVVDEHGKYHINREVVLCGRCKHYNQASCPQRFIPQPFHFCGMGVE